MGQSFTEQLQNKKEVIALKQTKDDYNNQRNK